MKMRTHFVSNSSSSSYIVIAHNRDIYDQISNIQENYGNRDTLAVDGSMGKTAFGWENEVNSDFWSKLNFCYIQAQCSRYDRSIGKYGEYVPNLEWMTMLENVLKNNLNVKNVEVNINVDYNAGDYAYIDHQSAAYKGRNIEMFTSERTLTCFLFNNHSYIQGGNDNE